ncbi:M13 family metallopeptidase [Asticcacaulis sp. EMRT-3]|uniref:M13 family metallopeptidase n=1 Tax=Asticcacaulis sp. EMRT-3 TaxID=3040349 RepID=UPI0024AE89AE|nr:M13 family metallopeptidase [Asticcacaulis sp. EMRT-3]MDI7775322.1 M13 family metallopeptidase [Asticcacaulis sp. EMRT-3]
MRSLRNTLLSSVMLTLPLMAGLPVQAEVVSHDVPQPYAAHSLMADLTAGGPDGGTDAAQMAELGKSYGPWGFNVGGMDTSIRPGNDFYLYANGKALKAMVIPGDQPGYGSFNKLADLSELREKLLVTGLAARSDLSGEDLKIADLYRSAMNTDLRNQLDAKPLQPELHAIAAITDKTQMAAYMGSTAGRFGSALFGLSVYDDAKRPGFYALQIGQAGLGLPNRDYYLTATYADKLKAYEVYITDMLTMSGYPDPAASAHQIVDFETQIAKVSWTLDQRRDDTKTYNPMALNDLNTYAPGFGWDAFFKGAGVARAQKVIVAENTAFPKIAAIFAATPLDTLKAWEAFHTVDQASAYLSDRFYNRRFAFRSQDLYGVKEQRPLWKRAVGTVDDNMPEVLGKAYAAQYFPPQSKATMVALVNDLLAAMKIRLQNVTWMTPATKEKALEKLSKFGVRIGYPDHWRDYSALVIKPDDLYGNIERSSAFEWAHRVSQIDGPIDPDDWGMYPQTVNAEYSPTRNEVIFPAAILQPPFFDPKADMAVNYGGIGAVIGHEITHGFDDEGRHYDGNGALVDWWTPEDSAKFEAQTKALAAQFDQYEPVPGVHVKGDQTMGENIADLGGLLVSYDAYHIALKGQTPPEIDGFSGDQRFYLGFAQIWQSKYQPDYMKYLVAADVHSPTHFRADGATRNVDAWYKAFDVQPGDAYYVAPDKRVRIW